MHLLPAAKRREARERVHYICGEETSVGFCMKTLTSLHSKFPSCGFVPSSSHRASRTYFLAYNSSSLLSTLMDATHGRRSVRHPTKMAGSEIDKIEMFSLQYVLTQCKSSLLKPQTSYHTLIDDVLLQQQHRLLVHRDREP
jgi:hypothetical protein